jgi:hypothetical protein
MQNLTFMNLLNVTKTILVFVFFLSPLFVNAQRKNFQELELNAKSDYKKNEHKVKEMAEYILSVPISKEEDSKIASRNILKWMTGTPDHDFIIDNSIMELSKKNEDLLFLYMAAITKAALNSNEKKNPMELKLAAFEILLDYCALETNAVKASKELKKAMQARKDGNLDEYLKL